MRRREFIALLSGERLDGRAPGTPRGRYLPLIGFLGAGSLASWHRDVDVFDHRLRELGWIDGRTVTVEYRWAEGHSERYAAIAAEFVRQSRCHCNVGKRCTGRQAANNHDTDRIRSCGRSD